MKAILYARCSTKEQGKSHLGLEAQIADMKRFCKMMDIQVVETYEEVVSGTYVIDRRPQFLAALESAKRKKDCFVLVSRTDRIARKMEIVLEAVDMGVKIVECGLSASRMEIQMRAMFAEEERNKISQRTSAALKAKLARGEQLGFALTDAQEKAIAAAAQANKKEADSFAEHLREIIEPMIGNKTLQEICDFLTKYKITTQRGGGWYPSTVKNIIARWK